MLAQPPGAFPIVPEQGPTQPPLNTGSPINAPAPPPVEIDTKAPAAIAAPAPRPGGNFLEAQPISRPAPELPAFAKMSGLRGVVVMEATVDKQGKVASIVAVSGHPILLQAAKNTVLKWRYSPATLNGEPIERKVAIRVAFGTGQD